MRYRISDCGSCIQLLVLGRVAIGMEEVVIGSIFSNLLGLRISQSTLKPIQNGRSTRSRNASE